MSAPHASSLVRLGIPAIAVFVGTSFVLGCARARLASDEPAASGLRRAGLAAGGVLAWLGVTGLLAASGVLARFDLRPPPLLVLMAAVVGMGAAVGLSPLGRRLARGLPLAALVGIQGFRLPLELVMHRAANEGVMPAQMTFGGWNYDIVTGVTALLLAPLIARGLAPRWAIVSWNGLGLTLAIAIGAIAVASTPAIHAFGTAPDRLNTWVTHFPYVWLPAGPVVFALAGHIIVARRLAAA